MYPDSGPSRPPASMSASGRSTSGGIPSSRGPLNRRDGDFDREERTGGYGRADVSGQPPAAWARPPGRADVFRPTRGRSRTPSPRRRDAPMSRDDLDRDLERFRDRERAFDNREPWPPAEPPRGPAGWRDISPRRGPTSGVGPVRERQREADWDWDRDRRRFNERSVDDRFREDNRNSSSSREPPLNRFAGRPSPPRSGRTAPFQTPPAYAPGSRATSGPRSLGGPFAPQRDERDRNEFIGRDLGPTFDAAHAGPGPSSQNNVNQRSPPAGPRLYRSRSQRGSSSPVESKYPRDTGPGASSVPSRTIPLPRDAISEAGGSDLEEGELVSPIKPRREFVDREQYDARFRDREGQPPYTRRVSYRGRGASGSPRKRPRSRSPPWRNRDGGWGGRARGRSVSVSADRRRSSPIKPRSDNESPQVVNTEQPPIERLVEPGSRLSQPANDLDRPPTPPPLELPVDPRPIEEPNHAPATVEPGIVVRDYEIDRPDTPAGLVGAAVLVSPVPETPFVESTAAPGEEPGAEVSRLGIAVHEQVVPVMVTGELQVQDEVVVVLPAMTQEPQVQDEAVTAAAPITDRPQVQDEVLSALAADLPQIYEPHKQQIAEQTHSDEVDLQRTISRNQAEVISPHNARDSSQTDALVLPTADTVAGSAAVNDAVDEPSAAHPSPANPISTTGTVPDDIPDINMSSSSVEPAMTTEDLPMETSDEVAATKEEPADLVLPAVAPVKESAEGDTAVAISESKVGAGRPRIETIASPIVRTTIAERRSMPIPGNASLSSPFNDRFPRKDPQPTGDSGQGSTDAETEFGPKTGEINDKQSEHSIHEDTREGLLRASIKKAQNGIVQVDMASIISWNLEALPTESKRVPSGAIQPDDFLSEYSWRLDKQQKHVATLVGLTIKRERAEEKERVARLNAEYMQYNREWQEHCKYLGKLMEARPPPPAELFAVPGAYIPAVTPGVVPTTPSEESSRADRRRRGMASDAVHTEAQYQEILEQLADDASRDPKFRANKTAATVPDMQTPHEMRRRYKEENDLVLDPLVFYDFAGKAEPIWTTEERATFLKRYLANPKQFGKIAEGLADKTASDCVLYYYRTKKEVDYKSLLASRRGDKKKRAAPITKGGKGSALLSNLGRQKPVVDSGSAVTPGGTRESSAAPTSTARRPKGARSEIHPSTPFPESASKRPRSGNEEAEPSAAASPVGSQLPPAAGSGKSKMRVTVRTNAKRPRITSVSETPYSSSALVPPPPSDDRISAEPAGPLDPVELLPPVKRAGKRRKVDPADPAAPPVEVSEKPKRNSTNSYWSVEDKKRFRDLFTVHGTDFALIASKLPNKSLRQVGNFYDAHKEELGFEAVGPRIDAGATGDSRAGIGPATTPSLQPFGRSVYDVQGTSRLSEPFERRQSSEPRMGVFNDRPHLAPPPLSTHSPAVQLAPPPSVTPRGGMSIMSLLNDAPSAPPVARDVDAVSDGTVSDRDAEATGSRPSPRSTASVPVYPVRYERRPSSGTYERPDLDRYRSSSARPFGYDATPWATQRANPGPSPGAYPPPQSRGPPNPARPYSSPYDSPYPGRAESYARPGGQAEPYPPPYPDQNRPAHPQYQQHPHPPPLPPPPIDRTKSPSTRRTIERVLKGTIANKYNHP